MEASEPAIYQETSDRYVGQWNRLVSTTNWEKGRIICQWRQSLVEGEAPQQEYSDEAWSRQVGGVSPQHVGRLRRVWERFAEVRDQYEGLYWSHFQAALDWDDAEMWLEGAVQNRWSVARMGAARCETLGSLPAESPAGELLTQGEPDEDAQPPEAPPLVPTVETVQDPAQAGGAHQADRATATDEAAAGREPPDEPGTHGTAAAAGVRPFENLPCLPDDLAEAVEQFKLAILRHKLAGWQEVAPGEVVAALDALKVLALAPSAD